MQGGQKRLARLTDELRSEPRIDTEALKER